LSYPEFARIDEMLASTLAPTQRRGLILILVLAMLALMALIGVTFATLSGQGKISARNFAQSVLTPQADALMDFALDQLIVDTGDVRSASAATAWPATCTATTPTTTAT